MVKLLGACKMDLMKELTVLVNEIFFAPVQNFIRKKTPFEEVLDLNIDKKRIKKGVLE